MNPDFEAPINGICEFWKSFAGSDIRKTYNYIKHKGKPLYKELAEKDNVKTFLYYKVESQGDETLIPTDTKDVQYCVGLKTAIEELISFDNNSLYDYIETLFKELTDIIQPSPFVF